ncbi:MAG: 1-acyl-sn-glycerol-3-phosphate acyltransferase [Thermoflavifilum sp.]|nr:1-acyl-sn-glycerol-3-phosphate acyltransferase [Thermoflavifilum sp.]
MTQASRIHLFARIVFGLFALYVALLFLITMIPTAIYVALCNLLFREPQRIKMILKGYRVWMYVFLPLAGCPFRISGKEHVQQGGPFVIVANHRSFMDILVMTPFVPGVNKTLAKKEFASIPVFNLIYKAGSVLVDRKNPASRAKSLEEMKHVLAQGMHIIIYPEGTRNISSEPLRSFQDGAFALAIDTQRPILPAVLLHTGKILPPKAGLYFRPHHIELHFLPPVAVEGLNRSQIGQLKQQVFDLMRDYYIQHEQTHHH